LSDFFTSIFAFLCIQMFTFSNTFISYASSTLKLGVMQSCIHGAFKLELDFHLSFLHSTICFLGTFHSDRPSFHQVSDLYKTMSLLLILAQNLSLIAREFNF